jgi:hypothetical protein
MLAREARHAFPQRTLLPKGHEVLVGAGEVRGIHRPFRHPFHQGFKDTALVA